MSRARGSGLVLVGYRGAGKSTVGPLAASALGLAFVDADAELARNAGRTVAQIFADRGEPAFRELESRTLAEVAESRPGAVLATGGGAILSGPNRDLLRSYGLVAWLRAEPRTLADRLAADPSGPRPSLSAAGPIGEVATILADRTPLYEEVADLAIDASRPPGEVADALAHAWRARNPRGCP